MPRINTQITPQERGSLFHRIVFRFYNERKEKGFTKVTESDQKEALQHIKTIAHEEFNKFYYDDPVWTAFKQKYLGDDISRQGLLETFIKKEIEDIPPDFSPAYFEL
jgi:ATP-dependent helicase/DNAse subunit B